MSPAGPTQTEASVAIVRGALGIRDLLSSFEPRGWKTRSARNAELQAAKAKAPSQVSEEPASPGTCDPGSRTCGVKSSRTVPGTPDTGWRWSAWHET